MKTLRIAWLALVAGGAAAVFGQSDVKLFAATAKVGSTVEVRLRWRISEGWIPAGGLKLYRGVGSSRQLVKAIPAPTDQSIAALLAPKFGRRTLVSTAAQLLPPGNSIVFSTPRPPSRLGEFTQMKGAFDGLKRFFGPVLPPEQIAQRNQLLTRIKAQRAPLAGVRGGPPGAVPPPRAGGFGAKSAPARPVLTLSPKTARVELHLAATLDNRHAEAIGLGATDKTAPNGATVTYALYGVSAAGQESAQPFAVLQNFVVGSDASPRAPEGVEFYQADDRIVFRWNRPPVDAEQKSLVVSYRITRATTPTGPPRNLTAKPLLLLSLPGNKEPLSFFSDTLDQPGDYFYRISMVDGFDRQGPPAQVQVEVADWRAPSTPVRAVSSLGRAFIAGVKGTTTGKRVLSRVQRVGLRIEPTVAWIPGTPVANLATKFLVYRGDLDQAALVPLKITASPIDGTVLTAGSEPEMDSAIAMILGPNYQEIHEANLATTLAREDSTPRDRAIAAAKAKALFQMQINGLKAAISAGRVRTFIDPTAQKDHKYFYLVTAVHPSSGLESEVAQAGNLDFPDLAKPPAVAGLQKRSFALAPARTLVFSKAPTLDKAKPFSAPAIRERFSKPKKSLGLGRGAPLPLQQRPLALSLVTPDYGGTLELSWSAQQGLKDVRYHILRRPSASAFPRKVPKGAPALPPTEFVEVGITAPNQATFRDNVPRSRARLYDYQVVALSRWGVSGPAATLSRVQVPTTIAPDVPNILSATPGNADGEIVVTVEAASEAQDVNQYVLFREGQQVQTSLASTASGGLVRFVDSGRKPGTVHTYTVLAETSAPVLKSLRSREVKCAAIKTSVAKPTNLVAQSTEGGVVLTWSAQPETTYVVRRRLTATGPASVLASKVEGGTFTDVFAMSGKTYIYEVAAVDSSGNVSAYETKTIAVP